MEYAEKRIALKNGRECRVCSAAPADAVWMVEYMRTTSSETPYMVRGPEEIDMTVEEEAEFLREIAGAEGKLMLYAQIDGRPAGSCSIMPVGERARVRHRCVLGISLYREFWGLGVGTALVSECLTAARAAGFEQAELEVVSTNISAIGLYEKLGFETVGTIPRALKYRDGSYADFMLMIKPLS